MTLGESILLLKQYQGYEPMFSDGEKLKHSFDLTDETVDTLLAALRPVSREQVEKVRGEWRLVPNGVGGKQYMCSRCGGAEYEYWRRHFAHGNEKFCSRCGAPMTDEAVEMVMARLEELYNA